jgi:hypothetical protein
MPFGWLHSITLTPTYSIISYGNITFYLCLDLHPLFQAQNYGIKQGLGVQCCA